MKPQTPDQEIDMNQATLGGRLPLLDPQSLTGAQRAIYDRIAEKLFPYTDSIGFQSRTEAGRLIGPFNAALFSPAVGAGFLDFMNAEMTETSLDERVRQIVILAVGAVWGASYELYAHELEARYVGLSDEQVTALAAGSIPEDLADHERIAGRLARQLTAERRVDAELYAEAEAAFGPESLVDLTLLVGFYHTICAVLNVFEVPAPTRAPQPTTSAT
jgi:4-carboxymuconolactone decarboxylase